MPRIPHSFTLSVVGESFENADGISRQDILRHCVPGEPIRLVADPDNPVDHHAIKVERIFTGEQLGYIRSERCDDLVKELISKKLVFITIDSINGGTQEKPHRGITLRVAYMD